MKLPPHYAFHDTALAQTALTHKSFGAPHNERLEWLGDAVVQLEVSRLLYAQFPGVNEGGLSKIRTRLVSRDALAAAAARLNLGAYARLGGAPMTDGRANRNLLANLMEAYIAAVYLDSGGAQQKCDAVQKLLADSLKDNIAALDAQIKTEGLISLSDAKTQLQEWAARCKQTPPVYELLARSGKANNPQFQVRCTIAAAAECGAAFGGCAAVGFGKSISEAEKTAAGECLRQLKKAFAVLRQPAHVK